MSAAWSASSLDFGLRDQVSLGMAAGLVFLVFIYNNYVKVRFGFADPKKQERALGRYSIGRD